MAGKKQKPTDKRAKREIITSIAITAVLFGIGLLLARLVFKVSRGNLIGFCSVVAVIVLLAFLKIRYPRADQAIEGAFSLNLRFGVWMCITVAPMLPFYWLSPYILKLSKWFQVIAFAVWGLLLIAGCLTVLIEKYRELFLRLLQRQIGGFAPCVYAFNLLIIAILFFSSVTYVLVDHGLLTLNGSTTERISPEAVRDFYSWHFLEALPVLKVNETLHWKAPLTYESHLVGLVVLLFQLIVIVPVIATFAWYWKQVAKPAEPT
jgi:hypothetical protein